MKSPCPKLLIQCLLLLTISLVESVDVLAGKALSKPTELTLDLPTNLNCRDEKGKTLLIRAVDAKDLEAIQ
ncbi:MAG: hypothetical protein ABIQ95_14615, partial [Bdellovibrionia bacterium]